MIYVNKKSEFNTATKQYTDVITNIALGGTEPRDKLSSLWTGSMVLPYDYDPNFCESLKELGLTDDEKHQLQLKVRYYLEHGSQDAGKIYIQFVDISLEDAPEGQVFKRILIILDYEDNEGHRYEDLCIFIKPENATFDAHFASIARKYELNVKPGYLYIQYDTEMHDTPIKTFEIWYTDEGTIRILENSAYY